MTTQDARSVFVDTNVLVYATVKEAPFHLGARQALGRLRADGADLWISRQVVREFLAVLTRPQTFAVHLSVAEVVSTIQVIMSQFRVAEDSAAVTSRLLYILEQVPVGGRQVH